MSQRLRLEPGKNSLPVFLGSVVVRFEAFGKRLQLIRFCLSERVIAEPFHPDLPRKKTSSPLKCRLFTSVAKPYHATLSTLPCSCWVILHCLSLPFLPYLCLINLIYPIIILSLTLSQFTFSALSSLHYLVPWATLPYLGQPFLPHLIFIRT